MLAYLWLLVASLAWVATDALRKGLAAPVGTAPLSVLLALGSLVAFLPWWALTGGGLEAGYALPAAISLAANTAATLLMLMALERGELSVVVPMLALTPVLSALGEWLVGRAPLAPVQWVGVALVVAGALGLQLRDQGLRASPASLMAFGVALLFSTSAVTDALAVEHAPPSAHAVVQTAGIVVLLGGFVVVRGEARRLVPPAGLRLRTAGAMASFGLAYGAQLVALQEVPASFMETVKRAIGMIGALALGWLLFGERLTLARVVAVGAMAAGVGLVLLTG
jgi:drug/metabolite transporter (DMT)-like permease